MTHKLINFPELSLKYSSEIGVIYSSTRRWMLGVRKPAFLNSPKNNSSELFVNAGINFY